MKQIIKSEVVAHSVSPQGEELISILGTFPRFILAEVNTHRMLSKNTSSSRAIPFAKMLQTIQEDPFIPIAWQKDHKGMQGTEYFTNKEVIENHVKTWLNGRDAAIIAASNLNEAAPTENEKGILIEEDTEGVTKQLCNRLLEPFMWTTMLITGPRSGWENFFHLRCPSYDLGDGVIHRSRKDALKYILDNNLDRFEGIFITELDWLKVNKGQAEIHMMALAECIWDAYNESTPKVLKEDEWHIPFVDKMDFMKLGEASAGYYTNGGKLLTPSTSAVAVSVAMAARTSYTVVGEEKAIKYEDLIALHDRLTSQDPPHSSPLEHCARVMSNEEHSTYFKGVIELIDVEDPEYNGGIYEPKFSEKGWCNNLKGFIPYRYFIDNSLPL